MSIRNVDRAIGETIRLQLIAKGRLVDVTAYTGDPDGYNTAMNALRTTLAAQGKAVIDVYGVGPFEDRDGKTDGKIVINRKDIVPGDIGAANLKKYKPNYDQDENLIGYTKVLLPDSTYHIEYEIRCIASSAEDEAFLVEFMLELFQTPFELAGKDSNFDDTGDTFTMYSQGSVDMTTREFMERIYRYSVRDAVITPEEVLDPNVPVLTKVIYDIHLWNPTLNAYDPAAVVEAISVFGVKAVAPQYTQAEIDAITAVQGMIVFNTTSGNFEGYTGTEWVLISGIEPSDYEW